VSGKILLVEDDPTLGLFYSRALRRAGYTVESALRGDDGLHRAINEEFDLVILDWCLPGMDGVELMTKLRAQRPNIRVLMLSGAGDEIRSAVLAVGADGFLAKPCDLMALIDAAGEVLSIDHRVTELSGSAMD
jgi:DNA-binding response OmpR family regulator